MYYPSVDEWVRVRGRAGEFIVRSADHAAFAADVSAAADPAASATNVDLGKLSVSSGAGAMDAGRYARHSREGMMRVLLATHEQMERAHVMFREMQEAIARTMQVIRASQQRIHDSDQLIARVRTLGCNAGNKSHEG